MGIPEVLLIRVMSRVCHAIAAVAEQSLL